MADPSLDDPDLRKGNGKGSKTLKDLKSDVIYGEETSGVRLAKYFFFPEGTNYHVNNDLAVLRLTEVVYALAECKLRMGDAAGCAELVNSVIKRNYDPEDWNNPALGLQMDGGKMTLDMMLLHWGKEFIGEGRRRIDLVRYGKFTSGQTWWAFNNGGYDGASDNNSYNLPARDVFPIPQVALNVNYNLKQHDKW